MFKLSVPRFLISWIAVMLLIAVRPGAVEGVHASGTLFLRAGLAVF